MQKVQVKGHPVQKLKGWTPTNGGNCIISHSNVVSNKTEKS